MTSRSVQRPLGFPKELATDRMTLPVQGIEQVFDLEPATRYLEIELGLVGSLQVSRRQLAGASGLRVTNGALIFACLSFLCGRISREALALWST